MKNNILILLFLLSAVIMTSIMAEIVNSEGNYYSFYGSIKSGNVELKNLLRLDVTQETVQNTSSVYTADFYSSTNSLLKIYKYDVYDGLDFETEELYKFFYFVATIPSETRKIIFKENGNSIGEFIISGNAPVVSDVVVSEMGASAVEISWQAQDTDNDELNYLLFYGNEGNWNLIDSEISETSYLIYTNSEYFPGGNHKIKVVASDGFNTGEAISQNSFSVAEKEPSVFIYIPEEYEKENYFVGDSLIIEASAYDPEDHELAGEWKINGEIVSNQDTLVIDSLEYGTHLIEFSATDSDGNQVSDEVEISVESNLSSKHAPILTPIGNQSVVEGDLIEFSVVASDEDNDTLTFVHPLASELPQGASFNITLNELGQIGGLFTWTPNYEQAGQNYQINFEVSDGELIDSEIINIEVTAPVPYIQYLSPTKGQVGSYLWISGKDFGPKNQASKVEFSNSNTTASAQISYWYDTYISLLVPQLVQGIYKVSVINQGGRSNSLDFTVISPPSLTITYPKANANVSSTGFDFTGTVKDDSGIAEVRVYVYDYGRRTYTVSNALANYNSSTNTWRFPVLFFHITQGNKATLWVQAKDTEGNLNPWQNIVVNIVDTTPPFLTITSPKANANVSNTGFNFTGIVEDGSGIAEVRVYVYDYGRRTYTVSNALANYNSNTNTWSFPVLSSHITQGKQATLWVHAKDTKGNWGNWQNIVVNIVDITLPSLTITSPKANANVSNTGFNFTGIVEDVSGIAEVRVYVYDYGRRTYTVSNVLANYNSNTNTWSFPVLSSHITQGKQATLWVHAKDKAGNWNYWQNVIVNVE